LILIVDSSILISALIKDSVTREILLLPFFEFLLPEYSLQEVEFRKSKISKLSGLSEDEIDIVLSLILENISIIPAQKIKAHFNEANNLIGKVDPNDIPFVALALTIWIVLSKGCKSGNKKGQRCFCPQPIMMACPVLLKKHFDGNILFG
jgi:predicted nucleic acid-binding protein